MECLAVWTMEDLTNERSIYRGLMKLEMGSRLFICYSDECSCFIVYDRRASHISYVTGAFPGTDSQRSKPAVTLDDGKETWDSPYFDPKFPHSIPLHAGTGTMPREESPKFSRGLHSSRGSAEDLV
jgi:hypothetical protein